MPKFETTLLKINGNRKILVKNGRQLKVATHSAQRILGDKADEQSILRVKKPGRYSKKWNKKCQ